MDLREVGQNWDEFGKQDPLWAILTKDEYRGNRWNVEEFFETGRSQVRSLLADLNRLNVQVARKRALDFGCGVGRLTQALCEHFELCAGVDIAPSMISQAEQHNKFGSRCQYHLNQSGNLRLFGDNSFDFILTLIVLQHVQPQDAKGYIREFIRVLAPGGVLVFQIPSERDRCEFLPPAAFRAQIATEDRSVAIAAGERRELTLRVKNISLSAWPAARTGKYYPVRLGNHWLAADGRLVCLDDGRSSLPRDVQPGDEVELKLEIRAPLEPGSYLLEFDMVQEGVAWFKDRGSRTCKVPALVERRVHRAPSPDRVEAAPRMEMNGIPKDEVLNAIQASGGQLIAVQDDQMAAAWKSHRYFVTKSQPPGR